jgi:hypothetical protein
MSNVTLRVGAQIKSDVRERVLLCSMFFTSAVP